MVSRVTRIATSFENISNLAPGLEDNIGFTGNPVRRQYTKAAGTLDAVERLADLVMEVAEL